MSRTLKYSLLTGLLVIGVVLKTWEPYLKPNAGSPVEPNKSELTETSQGKEGPSLAEDKALRVQRQIFRFQSHILLGAPRFFSERAESFGWTDEQTKSTSKVVETAFAKSLESFENDPLALEKIVVSEAIGRDYNELLESWIFKNEPLGDSESLVVGLLEPVPGRVLNSEEEAVLEERLGSLSQLIVSKYDPGAKDKLISKQEKLFKTFLLIIGLGTAFTFLAVLSFLFYGIQFLRRKLVGTLKIDLESDTLIEMFCLYLVWMIAGSYLATELFPSDSLEKILKVQAVVILSSLLLLGWPYLRGKSTLKLLFGNGFSLRSFFRELIASPFRYTAYLLPFLILMILYSQTLLLLGIDIESVSHPIAPILGNNNGQNTFFLVLFIAAVCAPLVEEVMFRGALYGWLRSKLSLWPCLFISGFIFAVVHPQGPIGVFPLCIIGMFFAVLREWRGNFVAPMLAHAIHNGLIVTISGNVSPETLGLVFLH